MLVDMDSVLEYEDRTAGSVGLLKHHIQELALRTLRPARYNSELPTDPSLPRQAASSDISAGTGARLPKLDLVRFDGPPTKWLSFWDLFRHTVHENPRLNNIDRFHYLQSLLDGPAAKAIVGILTTDNSYEDAVSILKERFGDVCMVEQKHLENLCTLRSVTTSANASALRSLYYYVQVSIRGLKGLGVSESCYFAMCEVLMKAIPQDIMVQYHRRWQLAGSSANDPPSSEELQQLLKYLRIEVQCRKLTSYQRRVTCTSDQQTSGSHENQTTASAAVLYNSAVTKEEACLFCQKPHSMLDCDASLPDSEKKRLLSTTGCCFRCTTK
ncbi:uncharacterized protein LOC142793265 [Rhipicephalus microplus]|uniref:uncharacterized protein LOC142793265 n=1 Tax=Rhipicephalus microplus TaxID=6941 RepID=UPI003F6CD888